MTRVRNKILLILALLILASGLIFVLNKKGKDFDINNYADLSSGLKNNASPLSGWSCDNYNRRPLAVVMANDPVTRPLSGLSQADLVFEMPVITGSITRLIAVYVCNSPEEIGSLRSARHDFIPLIQGIDGILVHWGGSHFALDKLNSGIMDNINAMINLYHAFYRKDGIPWPHNGFTSIDNLLNSAEKYNYRLENEFEGYLFQIDNPKIKENKILRIDYSYPYNVSYQYDPETNLYSRYRTNLKEIDRSNNQQIQAKNIVVMKVYSEQIQEPDYNDLDLEGQGECQVYQNGEVIDCIWQKSEKNPHSKLKFISKETNEEISFVIGQTWIELVEPYQDITWE